MRNDVMWAVNGGPIVGEIKHGKRYDSGSVSAEQYAEDWENITEKMAALQQVVTDCNTTCTLISNNLATLSNQYEATVPGLAEDINGLKITVTNLNNSINTTVAALERLETKEAGDIEAVMGNISTITTGLNALSDLVSEHSVAIATNESAVVQITEAIASIRSSVAANTASITAVSDTIAELTRTHEVDKATLEGKINAANTAITALTNTVSGNKSATDTAIAELRTLINNTSQALATLTGNVNAMSGDINDIETDIAGIKENVTALQAGVASASGEISGVKTTVTNLTATVNANNTDVNNRINSVQSAVNTNSAEISSAKSNIASLANEINDEKNDINRVEQRMTDYEVTQATLRNQILNVNDALSDRIDSVENDKNTVKYSVSALNNEVKDFKTDTSVSLSQLNMRVSALEGAEPLEIVSFKANPNIAELGGTENVVLTWNIEGNYEFIRINGEVYSGTGSEMTIRNVDENALYTLSATNAYGVTVNATADIQFVNHIYWGTNSNPDFSEGTVKSLDNEELSNDRERKFKAIANNEYIYFAYPKRLGTSDFMCNGFSGGFQEPRVVAINNHSQFTEDYYVYRSTNKISGNFTFTVY